MRFNIHSNIDSFLRDLNRIQQRQVPFATSKAINTTIADCRKAIIRDIKYRQKSGRPWWNDRRQGVLRKFSNKRRLVGSVYTNVYFVDYQTGGIKQPERSRYLAIPSANVPKSYRRAGGAQKMARGKRKPFLAPGSDGQLYVWRRKTKKRYPIEMLYSLDKKALVRTEAGVLSGFLRVANKTASRRFNRHFERALRQALKTAR